jgi:hypothetical protein
MYDDPEWRALAQPHNDVSSKERARGAGPARLAQHAGADNKSNMRRQVVYCHPTYDPRVLQIRSELKRTHARTIAKAASVQVMANTNKL